MTPRLPVKELKFSLDFSALKLQKTTRKRIEGKVPFVANFLLDRIGVSIYNYDVATIVATKVATKVPIQEVR